MPERWIGSGIVKVRTETDWNIMHNIKIVLTLAGFVRKQYNYLLLTKKFELLLNKEDYSDIFYQFLRAFTLKFNWAYNDLFDDEDLGQLGFLYGLYLINKYGKEINDLKYYTDLYFSAFPSFVEYDIDDQSMKESAFHTRLISRFALWFGFAEEEIIKGQGFLELEIKIKRTRLLEQLLEN